ncbi:MAG: hypothetical protein ACPGVB_11140 [Chitinophagales bacterium]
MKQFIITITMIFASITMVAQNGNTTTTTNADAQKKEQTTTTKEVKATEDKEEVSIFDNNILAPEVVASSDKNKEDK